MAKIVVKTNKNRSSVVYSLAISLALAISAIILPYAKTANALTIDSISKTQSSIVGGDEVVIKGSGFLKEEKDEIWDVVSFEQSVCIELNTTNTASDSTNQSSEKNIKLDSAESKLIIAKSGSLYEIKSDNTVVNISQTYNLGHVNIDAETNYLKLTTDKNESILISNYGGCGSSGVDRIVLNVSPLDASDNDSSIIKIEIDGENELCFGFSNGAPACMLESGKYVYYPSGNFEVGNFEIHASITDLDSNEKVTSVHEIGDNLFYVTTNLGRKFLPRYDTPSFMDVSNIFANDSETIILSKRLLDEELSDYYQLIITSSGNQFKYYDSTIKSIGRVPGLAKDDVIKQILHNYEYVQELTFTTSDDKILTYSYGQNTIVDELDIPLLDIIENQIIYLKDGTVYGLYDSYDPPKEQMTVNGEKIIYMAGDYEYLISTESGKVYSYNKWEDQPYEYVYTLNPDEKIQSTKGGGIVTTDGRYIHINSQYDESTDEYKYNATDMTSKLTQNFPSSLIPQISNIYFGSAIVTNFEIVDSNTIRAIVPSNLAGKYNVSVQSVGKESPSETPLIYEYVGNDNNSSNGTGKEESTLVTAPNTGYKRR